VVYVVGTRPSPYWDCGFESRRWHKLSVVRKNAFSEFDPSSRVILPGLCLCVCVCVINCYQVQQLPSTPTASGYIQVRIRIDIRNKMGAHGGSVGSGTVLQSKRHWNFTLTKSFRPHYGPGFDSVSNRNEY